MFGKSFIGIVLAGVFDKKWRLIRATDDYLIRTRIQCQAFRYPRIMRPQIMPILQGPGTQKPLFIGVFE